MEEWLLSGRTARIVWAGGQEVIEDAGGQLGSTGSVRLWALLRETWEASGGHGEVTWSDLCERSALVLGFRLGLDKGCRSEK